jgi:type IV secretion system protein VirB9
VIQPSFAIALMIPLAVSAGASAAGPRRVHDATLRPHPIAHAKSADAPENRLRRSPLQRVDLANRSAIREPGPDGYLGATQVYAWSEGALYRLYTAPGEVSDVALEPGESLVSVAAGDTVRWVIGDTVSGTGATRRTHVLVKPSAAGLKTNLVIATDRRVYHVAAESTAATAMASVSWTYPQDALLALQGAGGADAMPPPVDVAALNFDYRIDGDKPRWRPLRAFDDGHQVFIEFPATLGQGEAPPLFVRGEGGQPELVNYRIRGRYYVVDRMFDAAELRLGGRHQQVVRIVRTARPS